MNPSIAVIENVEIVFLIPEMTDEKNKMAAIQEDNMSPGFGIRHIQIMMMCVCATIIYVIRSSMGAAILAMTDTNNSNNTQIEIYNWSEEIRGVILSSFFWGYTLTQIPAGVLSKKFGGKILLLISLVVNGGLSLAVPFLARIGGWIAVCIVRVCMGLTQSCFMPSMHTLLGQWAPPQERTRLGILAYAGIQIGTIITMPICGVLSNTSMGWTLIFYCIGGLTLCAAVLFWFFTSSRPRQHRFIKESEIDFIEASLSSKANEEMPIPWRQILTSKPLYAILIAHIGGNWMFVIFLVQIPSYLKHAMGINLTNSAMLSALPFAAQWLVTLVFGFISDYLINNNILSLTSCRKMFNTIGSLGACTGLLIMSFLTRANTTLAVIVLICTVGISSSNCCGYMMNHLDLSPRFGGVMYSLTNCIANLFGILGPLSTGFILGDSPTDMARWRIVFLIAASMAVVSDTIYRLFSTSELQAWNEPLHNACKIGDIKKASLISSKTDDKEETVYSFPEKNSLAP